MSRCLIDRRGGHRRAVLAAYHRQVEEQEWSPERSRREQATRVAELLRHAKERVPFYQDRLPESGAITPESAFEVLASLPVVGREQIQSDPVAFRAQGDEEAFPDASGGSTGTPLPFVVDRKTQCAREASLYWSDSVSGWRYGERVALLWGSDRDVESANRGRRASARWWIENRVWLNSFEMGHAQMEEFHRVLSRFRPHLIVAYAGSLALYARFLDASGRRPGYPIRGLVSSAEVLTTEMRKAIEDVFRIPVFDRYGNREFGAIAAECSAHHGLHVNRSDMVLEIDRPDPTSEAGALLVTYLHNRVMPFLRYDTGDRVRWASDSPCPCGRQSSRLAHVAGRTQDMIRTADGRTIHGAYFSHLLYDVEGIAQYQFVQESRTEFRLRVRGAQGVADRHRAQWIHTLEEKLGAGSRVVVEQVEAIPVLPSGKRTYILSHLPPP